MKRIILSLAVSLDGFIEGPNREVDWMVFNEETGKALGEFLNEIDTIIYGKVSYETWGNYLPPENAPLFEKDFYERTSTMTKYVCSTSKEAFEGNPVVIKSNLRDEIEKLKQQTGKDIWLYGGAGLVSSFANLQLIDEFRIAVMPIILGKGNPLFKDIKSRINLTLLSVHSSKLGVTELVYQPIYN